MRSFVLLAVALLLPSAALPTLAQSAPSLGKPLNPNNLNKSQDPMDLFMRLQQLSTSRTRDFNSSSELDLALRKFHERQQSRQMHEAQRRMRLQPHSNTDGISKAAQS